MPQTYIDLVTGRREQLTAITTSTGAPDAFEIIATGADGFIDPSLLPPGAGPDIKIVTAGEALAARDYVNIYLDAGVYKARKADASAGFAKQCWGYVKVASLINTPASVYFDGLNVGFVGLTGEDLWLSENTPGTAEDTPPVGPGALVQIVGRVVSATEAEFSYQTGDLLAA